MGRVILGIVAGVVIAVAVVFAVELVVNLIAPPPADVDMSDREAVSARVSSLPMIAFALVLFGWVVGTGLGSWGAVRISQRPVAWPGLVVGAVIFCGTIYNIMTIPHPIWFIPISLLAIPIASWLGAKAARSRASAVVTA